MASITNNLNTARTQTFTYDQLDRIATAKTQATTGTYAWGLQFGVDIWGNLTSASVTQGSAPMLSVSAATNNRLSGYSYDALGNILNGSNSMGLSLSRSTCATSAALLFSQMLHQVLLLPRETLRHTVMHM